jgi:hemoglobin-like flavoprotein
MPITPDEKALLTTSLGRLQAEHDRFSTYFYDALFTHAPGLREMFRDDLSGQGMKFLTTLREVTLHIVQADGDTERLQELGSYHANLGVHADHFAPMENALVDTLRHTLGDEFTPELEAAWRKAYAEIAMVMIGTGGIT